MSGYLIEKERNFQKNKKKKKLRFFYSLFENRAARYMIITDRREPAIPDRNQGAYNISKIGIGNIPIALLTMSQLNAQYVVDPIRNPKIAKDRSSFVLSKDIIQFHLENLQCINSFL